MLSLLIYVNIKVPPLAVMLFWQTALFILAKREIRINRSAFLLVIFGFLMVWRAICKDNQRNILIIATGVFLSDFRNLLSI
jgi:hypothetical protein